MECQRVRMELGEFAAGELGRAHSAVLDAHLAACPNCRKAAEDETILG